jgi:AbrB family looped-hinge helix DNA binding protein
MAKKRGLSESRPKALRPDRRREEGSDATGADTSRASKWARIGPGGRIVIPAAMRKALGLAQGNYVQVRLRGGEIHVLPQETALRRVQDFVAKHASKDKRSWVDLLIEERKREVEREDRGE